MKEEVLKLMTFKPDAVLTGAHAAGSFSMPNAAKLWEEKGHVHQGAAAAEAEAEAEARVAASPWQKLRNQIAENFDVASGAIGAMSLDDFVHRMDMDEMLILLNETGQFVVKGVPMTAHDIFRKLDTKGDGVIHLLDLVELLDMPNGLAEIKECEAALMNIQEGTKTKIKQGKLGDQKTHAIHLAEEALADKKKQVMIRDSFRQYVKKQTMDKDELFQHEMKAKLNTLFVNADDGDRVLTREEFRFKVKIRKLKQVLHQTGQMERFNLDGNQVCTVLLFMCG